MSDINKSDLNSVISTAKQVLFSPVEFYQNMPKTGGFISPLIFTVVMGVVGGLIAVVLSFIGVSSTLGMAGGAASLVTVIMLPIFVVIGSFIGGFVLYVIWKLLGSEQSFETSYRCLAYASAIVPFVIIASIVPYLDTFVRVIWGTWLMIVSSVQVHQIAEKKAQMVFGVLGILMLLMGLSSQYASRSMEDSSKKLNQQLEEIGNMTPEELGKSTGEFLKGLEQRVKDKEKNQPDSENKEIKDMKNLSAEDAGEAVGDFLKGLESLRQ